MFYERLLKLISEKGISFYQLERDLGFANGSIKKFANSSPSASKVVAIAKYFGVSTDYLLDTNDNAQEQFYVPQEIAKFWNRLDREKQTTAKGFLFALATSNLSSDFSMSFNEQKSHEPVNNNQKTLDEKISMVLDYFASSKNTKEKLSLAKIHQIIKTTTEDAKKILNHLYSNGYIKKYSYHDDQFDVIGITDR